MYLSWIRRNDDDTVPWSIIEADKLHELIKSFSNWILLVDNEKFYFLLRLREI